MWYGEVSKVEESVFVKFKGFQEKIGTFKKDRKTRLGINRAFV
jgi:hypothetical protein